MRKHTVIVLCALAVACGKTPEQKADALIKEAMQRTLLLPETYQVVETQFDSAFTPYDDPAFIEAVLDICNKSIEINQLDSEIKRAKSSMAIWSGPYMSSYTKEQYHQAKEEYETAKKRYDGLVAKVQSTIEGLREQVEKEPEFIGYNAHHRYRADNNAGNTLLGEKYFLINKDLSAIIAQCDEDEIDLYNEFMKQATEAAELQK